MLLSFLLPACSEPPPPKEEPKAAASSCDVTIDKLDGTSWLWLDPNAGDKPNPVARVKFETQDGKLHGKYSAKSLGDVYDYTCEPQGKLFNCLETNTHADAFCKAWAAVNDGVCDAAGVAAAAHIPQADVDKVVDKVNKELKALKKKDEIEQQRKMDNSPNNKIRGKFQLALDMGTCKLTLVDKYQTMVDGKLNEYENQIGTAKFSRTKEDYIYESCKDVDSAWAPSADDDSKHSAVQPVGTVKLAAILQKDQKGAAGCTYTADIYKDWMKTQSDVPAGEDKKYGPRWDTQVAFTEAGRHAVFFDRYKTCDGKRDRIGLTCVVVRTE